MSGGGGGRVCGAPVHNVVVRDVGTDRNLSLQGCVNLVWSVSSQLTTHALSMTSANLPGKLGPQRDWPVSVELRMSTSGQVSDSQVISPTAQTPAAQM